MVDIKKLQLYQLTVVFSVLFSLFGFSYNVWRMEVTEQNSNTRTACFEMLLELSSLEQLVYAAHYDDNKNEGSPRRGWVKVGLVNDLSVLTPEPIGLKATILKEVWSKNWRSMPDKQESVEQIVSAIDSTRTEITRVLSSLE